MTKEKHALRLYLIIVFVLSAAVQALWIASGDAGSLISQLLMVIPMIAALAVKAVFYGKQALLGFRAGTPVYYLFAVLLPLGYIGLGYALYWLFVPGTYAGPDTLIRAAAGAVPIGSIPLAVLVAYGVTLLGSMIGSLGEEAGWRGFMYPNMQKMWGRNRALLVSGLIWAAWHVPLMLGGVYNVGTPLWYGIPLFILHILALNVIASWLMVKSGSVWPAAIWHAMQNFLNQVVFRSMTAVENSAYFIDETGFISTLSAVLCAALLIAFGRFNARDEHEAA